MIKKSLNLYWLSRVCQGKFPGKITKCRDTPLFFEGVSRNSRHSQWSLENHAFWDRSLMRKIVTTEGLLEIKLRRSLENSWFVWKIVCLFPKPDLQNVVFRWVRTPKLSFGFLDFNSWKSSLSEMSAETWIQVPARHFIFGANPLVFCDNVDLHTLKNFRFRLEQSW